jgi:hypothetical protein
MLPSLEAALSGLGFLPDQLRRCISYEAGGSDAACVCQMCTRLSDAASGRFSLGIYIIIMTVS